MMDMQHPFSEKQMEFIVGSTAKWNLAHGSVSSGKTVCTLFRFMQAVDECPDSDIAMIGHTSTTIYQNAVRLIMESPQLSLFRPFCTWFPSKHELRYKDKAISTIGAKDEGAIGLIQGRTLSLAYNDEMTLYPESVTDMIDTRLRKSHSMGFASMNPSHPNHKLKQWIDKAEAGDKNYYALHFILDDNPFVPEDYKDRVKNSLSGLFYKRNYLGIWCLADGAIFDFFEPKYHVVKRPPTAAEYWIAAIDYGSVNAFACIIVGINTGVKTQTGKKLWVEKEYFWDPKKKGRQKTNSEFADDLQHFLEPYAIKSIYIDPSAEAFQLELRKRGMHVVHANNDVTNGIQIMTSEMAKGNLVVCEECVNLIREIQSYVWDSKAAEKGYDEPLKKDDHAVDALRYAIASHKVNRFDEEAHYRKQEVFLREKYQVQSFGGR
jgi:PBSX family phage terminase large subunit